MSQLWKPAHAFWERWLIQVDRSLVYFASRFPAIRWSCRVYRKCSRLIDWDLIILMRCLSTHWRNCNKSWEKNQQEYPSKMPDDHRDLLSLIPERRSYQLVSDKEPSIVIFRHAQIKVLWIQACEPICFSNTGDAYSTLRSGSREMPCIGAGKAITHCHR